MSSQRFRKLDSLVSRLQQQHGPDAIRRATGPEGASPVRRISTTFPALDAALDGGLPRGRISEITGPATSGKVTLAAKAVAAAHREEEALAAWIDLSRTCDPDYLHRCGVDVGRLLVVRPATPADALALALHLVASDALAMMVFDTMPESGPGQAGVERADEGALAGALARLNTILSRSTAAVVFLVEPEASSAALAHAAALRLSIRRERWITRDGDVRGYEGHVTVLKNRLGRAGAVIPIRITFNGTVRGDGL